MAKRSQHTNAAFAPPYKRSTASLAHGASALGAKHRLPGFAVDPEHDLAFALGFPHLEHLLDGHPDDADAVTHAAAREYYEDGWPREVAARWCRLTACHGFRRTPDRKVILKPHGEQALARSGPITAEEGRDLLVSLFANDDWREDLRLVVRLVEAFVGPEVVAAAIAEGLTRATEPVWNCRDRERAMVVFHVGFSLLRATPDRSQELRAELQALFEREVAKRCGDAMARRAPLLLRSLDLALHGRVAAERSGHHVGGRLEVADLSHVLDDPEFVANTVRTRDPSDLTFDSRLVFLGGTDILDWWLTDFAKRYKAHYAPMVRHFGPIRSLKVAEMLEIIARGRSARDEAKRWLARQAI